MRHLMQRQAENSYRKMEEFVINRLREIMRSNRFDFFIPKVSNIEGRLKNGYYARHGFRTIKHDIRTMCQDALRYKDGNDLDDVKQIVVSFIQLAKRLGNPRYISERNGAAAQDSLDISQYSFDTKLKKKQNKTRANLVAAGADNSSRAFDLEIKRSMSKLKKKDVCSGSETSDDDGYSEGDETESETTVSDTESDFDVNSGA
ncbi:histone-lysine N-methyltransferase ATXR3-like [Zea mays]|uniref:histone-lysine N-methyltransferase ATXR3-like n=1 Tax=Zea mays TaxID=4577 RepID=UPI0016526711|nr:histone-lysine N-methyltransferase ATXR3-like [Zea mays]